MIKSDIRYLLKETKFFGMSKEELLEVIDDTYKNMEEEIKNRDSEIKPWEVES